MECNSRTDGRTGMGWRMVGHTERGSSKGVRVLLHSLCHCMCMLRPLPEFVSHVLCGFTGILSAQIMLCNVILFG